MVSGEQCGRETDLCSQNDVGASLEDLVNALLGNVRLAFADGLELLGIVDKDLLARKH